MSQEAGFLKAIVAEPDDDIHRLVYADWLEDKGNADRAAFIRGQIHLARTPVGAPGRNELAAHVHRLLSQHEEEWLGNLRGMVDEWMFRRGFVDKVTIKADVLRQQGGELFRLLPLRGLRVSGAEGDVGFLNALPANNWLTSLDLCANDLQDAALPIIASTATLPRLERLSLIFNFITDVGVRILCAQPFFARLHLLHCGGNPFDAREREALEAQFGKRVSFECERDEDHLYAFQDEGYYWYAGLSGEAIQVLMLTLDWSGMTVLLFDMEGNLLDVSRRRLGGHKDLPSEEANDVWLQGVKAWQQELGFQPGTIRVRKFALEEGEILDFPAYFCDPDYSPSERSRMIEVLQTVWLPDGQFEWTEGNSPWVNKRGEIVAT